jgi:hypothetical protein
MCRNKVEGISQKSFLEPLALLKRIPEEQGLANQSASFRCLTTFINQISSSWQAGDNDGKMLEREVNFEN